MLLLIVCCLFYPFWSSVWSTSHKFILYKLTNGSPSISQKCIVLQLHWVIFSFIFVSRYYRSVAYRHFVRLVWKYIGANKRLPLPCCVYVEIRKAFPNEDDLYKGYEEEEEEESEEEDNVDDVEMELFWCSKNCKYACKIFIIVDKDIFLVLYLKLANSKQYEGWVMHYYYSHFHISGKLTPHSYGHSTTSHRTQNHCSTNHIY